MLEPTYPSDPNGIEMTLYTMDPTKLKAPTVTIDDFYQAISRIKPSVAPEDLDR